MTREKSETVHFLVSGDYITDLARDLVKEGSYEKGFNMVQCFDGLDDGQCIAILAGKLRMSGWAVCDDPKCRQCKGKDPLYLKEDDVPMMSLQEAFKSLKDELPKHAELNLESFKLMMKEVQVNSGIKGQDLWMPVRCAMTGMTAGPELPIVIEIFGKQKMENLIDTLMNILIFIFIGLTIWLYTKEEPGSDDFPGNSDQPE